MGVVSEVDVLLVWFDILFLILKKGSDHIYSCIYKNMFYKNTKV